MHKNRKLVADTFCDVYHLLESWIDEGFWDLGEYTPPPGSICIVGRKQATEHTARLRELCQQDLTMIWANSAEGSSTQLAQLRMLGLEDLVLSGHLLLLSGGRLPDQYPYMLHEHFLVRVLNYQENIQAMQHRERIFEKRSKPYDFLFLNGRARPHRKYLWHRFDQEGLLDRALWTMLDGRGSGSRILSLPHQDRELMSENTPIRHLPAKYEVSLYRDRQPVAPDYPHQFIKFDIFNNEWGEIYLEPAPYVDTYFSVITETVLEYPYSFFTEKIAKPLAMGHPWIAATNRGFYRDLRNLGFQTFSGIIDEDFDLIDDDRDRMERIIAVVKDVCKNDLGLFLDACYDICKYNQQHLHHVVEQENRMFPQRFFQFLDRNE